LDKYLPHSKSARNCYKALEIVESQTFRTENEYIHRNPVDKEVKANGMNQQQAMNMGGLRECATDEDWMTEGLLEDFEFSRDGLGWGDPEDISWLTSMPFMVNLAEQ
jgi:hypothetical protein